MVGLNEFGEAAWSLEQVLNTWLADQKPASEELRAWRRRDARLRPLDRGHRAPTATVPPGAAACRVAAPQATTARHDRHRRGAARHRYLRAGACGRQTARHCARPAAGVDPSDAGAIEHSSPLRCRHRSTAQLAHGRPATACVRTAELSAMEPELADRRLAADARARHDCASSRCEFDLRAAAERRSGSTTSPQPATPTLAARISAEPNRGCLSRAPIGRLASADADRGACRHACRNADEPRFRVECGGWSAPTANAAMTSAENQLAAEIGFEARRTSSRCSRCRPPMTSLALSEPGHVGRAGTRRPSVSDDAPVAGARRDPVRTAPTPAPRPTPRTSPLRRPGQGDRHAAHRHSALQRVPQRGGRMVAPAGHRGREWALELNQRVPDSTVGLAHALAGSSATVGFHALSDIARALEGALQHTQTLACGTPQHGAGLHRAAEEIRRLLHQFAAGFLKEPEPRLLEALQALEAPRRARAEPARARSAAPVSAVDALPPQPAPCAAGDRGPMAPPAALTVRVAPGAGWPRRRRGRDRRRRCDRPRPVPDLRGRGDRTDAAAGRRAARSGPRGPTTAAHATTCCARCTRSRAAPGWPARCAWARLAHRLESEIEYLGSATPHASRHRAAAAALRRDAGQLRRAARSVRGAAEPAQPKSPHASRAAAPTPQPRQRAGRRAVRPTQPARAAPYRAVRCWRCPSPATWRRSAPRPTRRCACARSCWTGW